MRSRSSVSFKSITGPEISLPTEHGALDLHAYMTFKGFRYSVEGTLVLQWHAKHAHVLKVRNGYIASVELVFVGVKSLAVTPRDPDIPVDADGHLEDFEPSFPGNRLRVVFNFNGGMSLAVCADDAVAELTFEEDENSKQASLH